MGQATPATSHVLVSAEAATTLPPTLRPALRSPGRMICTAQRRFSISVRVTSWLSYPTWLRASPLGNVLTYVEPSASLLKQLLYGTGQRRNTEAIGFHVQCRYPLEPRSCDISIAIQRHAERPCLPWRATSTDGYSSSSIFLVTRRIAATTTNRWRHGMSWRHLGKVPRLISLQRASWLPCSWAN